MCTDLIRSYVITAKQIQLGGKIKEIELKLTAITMVDPETGWFEIVEVLYYSIEDTKIDKHNYIHNSSARVSRLFSQT